MTQKAQKKPIFWHLRFSYKHAHHIIMAEEETQVVVVATETDAEAAEKKASMSVRSGGAKWVYRVDHLWSFEVPLAPSLEILFAGVFRSPESTLIKL
jgi:predicted homoserine dehydrogenase-like protein